MAEYDEGERVGSRKELNCVLPIHMFSSDRVGPSLGQLRRGGIAFGLNEVSSTFPPRVILLRLVKVVNEDF